MLGENPMINLRPALLAVLLATTAAAFAHGDKVHEKPAGAVVIKEQKDWGVAGDRAKVDREIVIHMTDQMRFVPDHITVRAGETIRFIQSNDGNVMHEMVIGTREALDEHAALMKRFPEMEHDEPYMAHVAPGKKGEIVWTFNRAGTFEFACLIPGHYEAGMVGGIGVTGAKEAQRPTGRAKN
jgi:uncharacterized cupredoxin-like copper-binding protein